MNKMVGITLKKEQTWFDQNGGGLIGFILFFGFICGMSMIARDYHDNKPPAQTDTVYNIHLKGGTFFDNDYYTYDYHYDKGNIVFRNIHRGINMVAPKDAVISITEEQWGR